MKKYDVTTTLTLTVVTTVMARDEEHARVRANKRAVAGLCHACGGNPNVEYALCDGLNGELGEDLDVEELT